MPLCRCAIVPFCGNDVTYSCNCVIDNGIDDLIFVL